MHRLSKAVTTALTGTLLILTSLAAATPAAQAQKLSTATPGKLAAAAPVTYDNKYEIYGGLNFMNFQAGQFVTERMNLGGAELLGTYWVTHKLGLGLDLRGDAGTTPATPSYLYTGRPLVVLYQFMGGAQYRGPKNQHAALNYHAYGGGNYGVYNETAGPNAQAIGLYANHTSPIFALGASVDFNRSKNLAIRIQPDLILERAGTSTREFFAISGGIVYRIGKK